MSIEINNVAVRASNLEPRSPAGSPSDVSSTAVATRPTAEPDRVKLAREDASTSDESSGAAGLDAEKLAELADDTSNRFQALGRELQFEVAEMSGRTVITVLDRESGDIIRSIPPEKLVEVSEYLREVRQPSASGELSGVLLGERTVA